MSRSFRLTRRAEESLLGIARWTVETFGQRQADIYEAELLDRCAAIAEGVAHSRSCTVLVDGAGDMRYVMAGEHFLVFLERPDAIIILDILHSRCNLPHHIAALATMKTGAG